ncbi:MAG: hypothetical protein Q8Q37_01405 [bacterium]|nr:hypothetical protein [bacterium]
MNSYHEKIARILRIDKHCLVDLERNLERATSKVGIFKKISDENEELIAKRLDHLGLARHTSAVDVYDALISKVEADDVKLFQFMKLESLSIIEAAQTVVDFVKKLHPPQKGYFLKIEKARQFLIAEPPKKILIALGYQTVEEMLAKEDILEVYSAIRFLEDPGWLNNVFFKQYESLTPDDFEERQIELKALNIKWAKAAERFVAKKYHNVSHLKELGVIFIIPIFLGISGETLRLLSLLTHYLNEVSYYADLFKKLNGKSQDFALGVISLLRGDVISEKLPELCIEAKRPRFLVVQRYLAKDDENDWRLSEPRVNPEALHWQRAEGDISKVNYIFPQFHNGLDFWNNLGWVGDFFPTNVGVDILISFNIVDTVMALVKQKEMIKYLYHHQEALWNKIFIEYFSLEKLEKMSKNNILKGWFEV